ncbi:MAG: hypothetical protein QOF59_2243 [Actinomycetota bacterium]|nr:hypothetical protein [Actinomycetota bacterium]
MLRSGRSRRRFIALITYYSFAFLLVGPTWFAPVEADTKPRVPVLISLNVALRTRTTDVATFTTPFPMTVGVAADGTFTIPRDSLGFALVDVPLEAAHPGLGRLSVRAEPVSDFGGMVDTRSGQVTLAGFLELLWTQRHPAPGRPAMVDCPVGPFAVHLSTQTVGGALLGHQSLADPTSRTARLVDDNFTINAIPVGTPQCGGAEGALNQALSLPILAKVDTTTSTSTTTIAPTTTSSELTTTTTAVDPNATSTTVGPTSTTIDTTTTIVAPTQPMTPNASLPDAGALALTAAAAAANAPRVTSGLGTPLDPGVLAFEPIPSVVSTLTIAAVPTGSSTTTTQPDVTPRNTPSTVAAQPGSNPPAKRQTVAAGPRRKHKPNKHAQTTDTAAVTTPLPTPGSSAAHNATPPLYFSPLNFGGVHKSSPHNPLLAPVPILGLGAEAIAKHRDIASIVFMALLILPLIAISAGLVAADFGARVPFLGRRRRRARGRTPRPLA